MRIRSADLGVGFGAALCVAVFGCMQHRADSMALAAEATPKATTARTKKQPTPRQLTEEQKRLLKTFILDTDVDPDEGSAPLTVHFSVDFLPVDEPVKPKFEWDFGDGTPKSHEQKPTHTYKKPGKYKAVVRVTDEADQSGEEAFDIEVLAPSEE